jgi:SWI/SNF related-matrix-associated actin-dependent regulator of chromatin subfamily C
MDDDSINFGSPAAAATPNSNSILAQPPLQGDSSAAQDGSAAAAKAEGTFNIIIYSFA